MPLLKNNAFVADAWVHVGAEEALPEGGNVAIPFSRLKNEWESLAKFPGQLGALLMAGPIPLRGKSGSWAIVANCGRQAMCFPINFNS